MKIPHIEYTTQRVEDKLKGLEYKNITGTSAEKELVAALSNKKPFVLGVINIKPFTITALSTCFNCEALCVAI